MNPKIGMLCLSLSLINLVTALRISSLSQRHLKSLPTKGGGSNSPEVESQTAEPNEHSKFLKVQDLVLEANGLLEKSNSANGLLKKSNSVAELFKSLRRVIQLFTKIENEKTTTPDLPISLNADSNTSTDFPDLEHNSLLHGYEKSIADAKIFLQKAKVDLKEREEIFTPQIKNLKDKIADFEASHLSDELKKSAIEPNDKLIKEYNENIWHQHKSIGKLEEALQSLRNKQNETKEIGKDRLEVWRKDKEKLSEAESKVAQLKASTREALQKYLEDRKNRIEQSKELLQKTQKKLEIGIEEKLRIAAQMMLDPTKKDFMQTIGGAHMIINQLTVVLKAYHLIATLQSEEKRTELYKEMDQIIEKKENKKIKKNEEIKK
eukprot:Platyproteum_vivax@DN5105_c1_g2_i1.p1